jgi:hypothetical protein
MELCSMHYLFMDPFFVGLVFELRDLCLQSRHSAWATLLCFGHGLLWAIHSGWSQAVILLISVFQIARIIGLSHWFPAIYGFSYLTKFFW